MWNGIWTFFLTLVPFATRWVGEHPNDTLPDETNTARVRLPMYLGYGVAMLVSFFVPILSLVTLLAIEATMTVGIFRMMYHKV